MSLGIAGLKDKKAIAKQWISIYDRALKKAGGERVFLDSLKEICRVLETWRHETPLNMSTPITNTFHITFKATKNLGQDEKQKSIDIVKQLLNEGYPNLFGSQRFGIKWRNSTQGFELMRWINKETYKKTEAIFKLQAYSSKVFNEFVEQRAKSGLDIMDGDILTRTKWTKTFYWIYKASDKRVYMVDIRSDSQSFFFVPKKNWDTIWYNPETMMVTGPLPGFNSAISDPSTDAWVREAAFLKRQNLDAKTMKVYKTYQVFGLRRAIRVFPHRSKVRYKEDNLLIDFTLPSGSYASIVFDALDKALR